MPKDLFQGIPALSGIHSPIASGAERFNQTMNKKKTRRSRNVLSLATRMAVIHDFRTLTKNARILSERHGCGRTQIQNIIKARKELITLYKLSKKSSRSNNRNTGAKYRVPETVCDSMAIVLSEWSQRSQDQGLKITESLLESAADNIAPLLGVQDRRPKEGWVKNILAKYDFSFDRSQHKAPSTRYKSLKYTDIMDELGIKYSIPSGLQYIYCEASQSLEPFTMVESNDLGKSLNGRTIKQKCDEPWPALSKENLPNVENTLEAADGNQQTVSSMKEVNSYREALNVLGPLERFALLKGNIRAVGFINQLENLFRKELEKILQDDFDV